MKNTEMNRFTFVGNKTSITKEELQQFVEHKCSVNHERGR